MPKMLIISGVLLITIGIVMYLSPRIPWIGKLPGDILIKKENLTFYFPITTSIIVSIILSLLLYLFGKR